MAEFGRREVRMSNGLAVRLDPQPLQVDAWRVMADRPHGPPECVGTASRDNGDSADWLGWLAVRLGPPDDDGNRPVVATVRAETVEAAARAVAVSWQVRTRAAQFTGESDG